MRRDKSNEGNERAQAQPCFRAGALILGGRYRIIRLLYQRPRLNLYLGRRVVTQSLDETSGPLVAIRELLCNELSPLMRTQIEAAINEEFTTPVVLGASHVPAAGDRCYSEGGRYYYCMQLQPQSKNKHGDWVRPVVLETLLQEQANWPIGLDSVTALQWGTQLGRMVARLHRLGVVLGDLSPRTILVDANPVDHTVPWLPLLLPSWPPAPCFWQLSASGLTPRYLYQQVFPSASVDKDNPFVAPEVAQGIVDERSDVYSLAAILYLLLTHYAPVSAARRLAEGQKSSSSLPTSRPAQVFSFVGSLAGADGKRVAGGSEDVSGLNAGLELILPQLLSPTLSPELGRVILRALALSPASRFPSVFAMVEVLESIEHNIGNGRKK